MSPLEPGFTPVTELAHMMGRDIPVVAGPSSPLTSTDDGAWTAPDDKQAGIEFILNTLRDSEDKVVISVVGSARSLAAAFNRNPELLLDKVDRVLMNAGSSGPYLEWNVYLDPYAYISVMRSGLPVDWYPCASSQGPFDCTTHNTYWQTTNHSLIDGLPVAYQDWFAKGLRTRAGSREWEVVCREPRNMWSTASLVMTAGRCLAKTPTGWAFVRREEGDVTDRVRWSMEPVGVVINDDASTRWTPVDAGNRRIRMFTRKTPDNPEAMAEALNRLLKERGDDEC
jgi:hypothetical protein